jgi:hypothetical protein
MTQELMDDLKTNLGWTEIPEDLAKLVDFLDDIEGFDEGDISECFGLGGDKSGLTYGWTKDSAFLERLSPFAYANGTGSFYAIWDDGSGRPLNQWPIVVFGDEGGEHIVAENLRGLFHLLTYGSEITVENEETYFYREEDEEERYYEESPYHEEFAAWVQKTYSLAPIERPDEANALIKAAQAKYQQAFNDWTKPFFKAAGII